MWWECICVVGMHVCVHVCVVYGVRCALYGMCCVLCVVCCVLCVVCCVLCVVCCVWCVVCGVWCCIWCVVYAFMGCVCSQMWCYSTTRSETTSEQCKLHDLLQNTALYILGKFIPVFWFSPTNNSSILLTQLKLN